ncbi:hydrogenase 3 membrane subunit, partial [Yersinia enterocolitica]
FGKLAVLSGPGLLWALVACVIKLVVVFVLASIVENSIARGRFLLTSRVTWLGFGVAALSLVFYLTGL